MPSLRRGYKIRHTPEQLAPRAEQIQSVAATPCSHAHVIVTALLHQIIVFVVIGGFTAELQGVQWSTLDVDIGSHRDL